MLELAEQILHIDGVAVGALTRAAGQRVPVSARATNGYTDGYHQGGHLRQVAGTEHAGKAPGRGRKTNHAPRPRREADAGTATIGAYVVVNREGWILTASHLIEIVRAQQDSARRHAGYQGNVVEFHRDVAADKRYRRKGVRSFHKPGASSVRNHSVWWGEDGVRLVEARVMPAADLALGHLEPFDPASVAHYPVWKNPSRDFAPGRSLCKLGFPLHWIVPVYDEKANTFTLPEGSVPLPLFPMEGMFTRVVNTRAPRSGDAEPSPFIKTSTPSLLGQMGGPVFDAHAVVWGIQSHTMHHALGFRPPVPGGNAAEVAHQFLNTGLAAHSAVIERFLEREKSCTREAGELRVRRTATRRERGFESCTKKTGRKRWSGRLSRVQALAG